MREQNTLKYATATGAALHVDTALSEVALNYRPPELIAESIMPVVPVPNESGIYTIFQRSEWLRREKAERARGAEANKISWGVNSGQYRVTNYALKTSLYLEDLVNADEAAAEEMFKGAARRLKWQHGMQWEQRALNLFLTAANVATTFVPASAWSGAGADPISQLTKVAEQFQGFTSMKPNRIVFGWRAWALFRRHPNVRSVILGSTGAGFATRESVKNLLELDEVLVSNVFVNSANEAQAEALSAPFYDKVALYFAPPKPTREDPSWGYSFRWTKDDLPNMQVELHPADQVKKIRETEVGYYQGEFVTAPELGCVISGVDSAQGSGLT